MSTLYDLTGKRATLLDLIVANYDLQEYAEQRLGAMPHDI